MKIEPTGENYNFICVLLMIVGICICCIYVNPWHSVFALFWVVCCVAVIIVCFIQIYVHGRTCNYHKEGVEISFLWYKKLIEWKDIPFIEYTNKIAVQVGFYQEDLDGVVFSTRSFGNKRPFEIFFFNLRYFQFIRPFSSFFVVFDRDLPDDYDIELFAYPIAYKNQFLSFMKEWGVEIKGVDKA